MTHFGGELVDLVQSLDAWFLSHFTHLEGLPQQLDEWPKNWHLKHCRTGREFLNFSHLIMQWHNLRSWSTLRMSVPGWKVITNIWYLAITARVFLSVLVIWDIRTTWMSCATSSARTSSSGTFGGIPFSSNRGWISSGNVCVWYASLAVFFISVSRMLVLSGFRIEK
jgi:hypothetical protein